MIKASTLEDLYLKKKLSMMQIAKKLGVSHNKVVYWMEKHGLKRRNRNEATYVYFNPNGDPFSFKQSLSSSDYFLKGLGLGLFWGEGTKRDKFSIRLSNSDPKLIKTFLEFLRKIYGVNEIKLRFALHVFSDINPEEALDYWAKELRIPKERFYKTQVVKLNKKGTYKKKSRFGVLTIVFPNKKLRDIILKEIQEIKLS